MGGIACTFLYGIIYKKKPIKGFYQICYNAVLSGNNYLAEFDIIGYKFSQLAAKCSSAGEKGAK